MKKFLTKEELAAKLDGCEYRDDFPEELLEAARKNNLVILHGASDDLIQLHGAINEEIGFRSVIPFTRNGAPESDCDNQLCPYFRRSLESALKRGKFASTGAVSQDVRKWTPRNTPGSESRPGVLKRRCCIPFLRCMTLMETSGNISAVASLSTLAKFFP